ncbi:MAG: translesion error-prone DNA polymerase V autoproteolytic subunit [Candidatus Aureabacteria bacterium]|nr:translesion error-prone DNA polymerase V autoproteolytic subunit [Candidatus Auribacterota bacterium]
MKIKKDPVIKEIYRFEDGHKVMCPIFESRVAAGFPSPADDFIERKLDLNEFLVRHPSSTFFVRVSGDSMIGAGINHNDILIVDRSLEVSDKAVIIAVLDGELTVKRYREKDGKKYLMSENPRFKPMEIGEKTPFELWGVVTSVIHKVG